MKIPFAGLRTITAEEMEDWYWKSQGYIPPRIPLRYAPRIRKFLVITPWQYED